MTDVVLGIGYYPDPTKGRPVFFGSIFVGEPNTDPEILGNQKQISIIQEDGTVVPVSQPVKTGAGGVPLFDGSPVKIFVSGGYSLKVLNKKEEQVYFVKNSAGAELAVNIVDFGALEGNDVANASTNGVAINNAIKFCKDNNLELTATGIFYSDKSFFTGVSLAEEAAGGKGLKSFICGGTDITLFKFVNSGTPAFENTGGRYQVFKYFTIEGIDGSDPSVGLLMARVDRNVDPGGPNDGVAPSAGEGWMSDIEIRGFFDTAAYYNFASEGTRLDRFTFENRNTSAPCTGMVCDTNVLGVVSPNSQIAGTSNTNAQQSSIWNSFNEPQIFDYTVSSNSEAAFRISGCKSVYFNSIINFSSFNAVNNSRYFQLERDTANGGLNPQAIYIQDSFYHESLGRIAVYVKSTVEGLRHRGNRGASNGLFVEAGNTLNGELGSGEHNILEFEMIDASASTGTITIVNFANLSGDTMTISGLAITEVIVTEGVDWTAATSNDATATSLAAAIEAETGLTASATGAVVTVNPNPSTGIITSSVSSDGTNMTSTLARVSLLGRTDCYVSDSFEISNFMLGNLYIPDGGLTALRIGDESRFLGSIFNEDGSLYVNEIRLTVDGDVSISSGIGSPEGVLARGLSSTYHNKSGGAGVSFFVKETGASTNTGWVGK